MPQTFATALVTGASSGIGDALARDLARRGSDLVLVARRADRLERLASEVMSSYGVNAEVLPADLATDDGVDAVAARLADATRPVDLLVNNAGDTATGELATADAEAVAAQVRVNLLAVIRLARAALPGMVARSHGGILNVSSLAGYQPLPGASIYSSTKAAVTVFSESLHAELRRTGVHVTVLAPGFTWVGDGEPRTGRMWLDRHAVARAALDAVERNRTVCVPGAQYKALLGVVGGLPRSAVRFVTARVRPI